MWKYQQKLLLIPRTGTSFVTLPTSLQFVTLSRNLVQLLGQWNGYCDKASAMGLFHKLALEYCCFNNQTLCGNQNC